MNLQYSRNKSNNRHLKMTVDQSDIARVIWSFQSCGANMKNLGNLSQKLHISGQLVKSIRRITK